MPEIDALMDFAGYFGVSVSYLLGDSDIRDLDGKYSTTPTPQNTRPIQQPAPNITPDESNLLTAAHAQIKQGRTWPEIIRSL